MRQAHLCDSAPTEVVAHENTLNGTIFPQDEIVRISDYVHSHGLKMHLDGARIWHVAAETGTTVKELCDPFDSVSLCMSKGLGELLHLPQMLEVLAHVPQGHLSVRAWSVPKIISAGLVGLGSSLAVA